MKLNSLTDQQARLLREALNDTLDNNQYNEVKLTQSELEDIDHLMQQLAQC